jgi:hypothetical protein
MYRPGTTPRGASAPAFSASLLNGAALPYPIEMVIDATGEPFTGLVVGDWPGHSPSVLGCGRDGKLAIGSFEELSVTDARVIPNDLGHTIRARRQLKTEAAATRARTKAGKPAAK